MMSDSDKMTFLTPDEWDKVIELLKFLAVGEMHFFGGAFFCSYCEAGVGVSKVYEAGKPEMADAARRALPHIHRCPTLKAREALSQIGISWEEDTDAD